MNQLIKELETINQDQQQISVPYQHVLLIILKKRIHLLNPQFIFQQQNQRILSIQYRLFPNNKTTMHFSDFQELYNECISNKDQHDELLESGFSVFDFDKSGTIDSKKIRKVFSKFKDNTSEEEIQNVLKFCGVLHDQMSLQELKEFFKKKLMSLLHYINKYIPSLGISSTLKQLLFEYVLLIDCNFNQIKSYINLCLFFNLFLYYDIIEAYNNSINE